MNSLRNVMGWSLLAVGVAVFAIRLQHAGPYDFPEDGNLLGGVLALLLGAWLVLAASRFARPLTWLALAASPVVLFFALYATLSELEEVVVLKATDRAGQPADLRLWIIDRDDGAWVTMEDSKADAHGLGEGVLELLREGELACVMPVRFDEHERVDAVHQARHGKYRVQQLATLIGIFGRSARPGIVALRLDPCPG